MSKIYSDEQRALQQRFDTVKLADRIEHAIVRDTLAPEQKSFIETRDMFFLSTVDPRGFPTCYYKGGAPGFVRVIDPRTLVFPIYNGNGMFLSAGNISANHKIGMLFIDFETPHRLRVHGEAQLLQDDPQLREFTGAEMLVRVTIHEVFINCPRYIHRYQRLATSKYAPQAECPAPPPPQWKRIDALQDVLPANEQKVAETLGGTISFAEYAAAVAKGEG